MKNEKNEELNFLYLDDKYTKKDSKKEKNTSKKKATSTKKKKQKNNNVEEDVFNFDNEIVIGVTKLPKQKEKDQQEKNKKKQNHKSKKENTKKIENAKGVGKKKSAPEKKKNNKTSSENVKNVPKVVPKKNRIARGIIKWAVLLSALIASIIFFMMSPLFNLVEISVIGNEKIQADTIISLSGLQIGENIYKISTKILENNIKQNTYIESVNIERNLPNKIMLEVKERKATFMLQYANSYIYLNNQGYLLEISEQKLELPIIVRIYN